MSSKNRKSPFKAVVHITDYTKTDHPLSITEYTIRADTLKELRDAISDYRTDFQDWLTKTKWNRKEPTIDFGPELKFDRKTGKYNPLPEKSPDKERKTGQVREAFVRLLRHIIPSIAEDKQN